MKRYLTKSRFKLGLECPTKLFYTKKKEYLDQKIEDPFLKALADGGYQVGELAKQYFKGGYDIADLDYDLAKQKTDELLKKENVIVFEPAIQFENLFIRIDILIKRGKCFELIEVKSKSFDSHEEEPFLNKNGTLSSSWKPYLYDVAFQKYVLQRAFPDSTIATYLMMVDKNAKCPVDGLNQKFRIVRDQSNRKGVRVSSCLTEEDLKEKILIQVPVDFYLEKIYQEKDFEGFGRSFFETVSFLAEKYEKDEKVKPQIGSHCKKCEFQCSIEEEQQGFKNGFKECWSEVLGWSDADFKEPTILEIWNFKNKDRLIKQGTLKLREVTLFDINIKPNLKKPGLSTTERQWLQVKKAKERDSTPYIDARGLKKEMDQWKFPLHFIDFETTAVAIPFYKGLRPYEGVAFQFSHHVVYEDGTVEHKGQFLNATPGEFPNFSFIRALKKELDQDEGTIFNYATHENSFLNYIYNQLETFQIEGREELKAFIKMISKSTGKSVEKWEGKRNMVDLCDLVKRYYYDPYTKGSNSIKYVLPAILNSSQFLKDKYSKPIYGAEGGIKSLNFKDWTWIQFDGEKVRDPYTLLPRLFQDISEKDLKLLLSEEYEIKNGGAALTAYGKLQFTEMTDYERKELEGALLKYCELDTLAMVMIYEGWRELIAEKFKEVA